jgi:hypothetical protein
MLPMILWFAVLVLAPGVWMMVLRRRLPPYRIDGNRMDLRVWRFSDADSRNYSEPGKRVLRMFRALQGVQVVGFVLWGAVFIL